MQQVFNLFVRLRDRATYTILPLHEGRPAAASDAARQVLGLVHLHPPRLLGDAGRRDLIIHPAKILQTVVRLVYTGLVKRCEGLLPTHSRLSACEARRRQAVVLGRSPDFGACALSFSFCCPVRPRRATPECASLMGIGAVLGQVGLACWLKSTRSV